MPTAKRLHFSVVIAAAPAKAWATMLEPESYREWTRLVIDQDVTADYEAMMGEIWPKALERLRALCEGA